MYSSYMVLILTLLCLDSATLINAALFILQPSQGSTCKGGQPCLVSWLDDGVKPLLSEIGLTTVGLYRGKQQLVQTIAPVNVANSHSITFTPLPTAGPSFDAYYIAFTSTQLVGNDSIPVSGFSPFFSLTGMSGSFESPLAAATSSIPIPTSSSILSTSSETHTVTVGTLSTSISLPRSSFLPAPTTAATSAVSPNSKLSTSTTPSSASTSTSTPTTSSTPAPSAAGASGSASRLSGSLFLLCLALSPSVFFS